MAYDLINPADARVWPFPPDWTEGFQITRSFLTDIVTSRSNKEQRRALRDTPRMSVRMSSVLSFERAQAGEAHLRGSQNRPAAIPDFTRFAEVTGAASISDTTLTIASPPIWIEPLQIVALCFDGMIRAVIVDSVAGDTVTLAAPLSFAVPAGTVVRPTFHGLYNEKLRQGRLRPTSAQLEIAVDAYPGGEPPEDEGTPAATFNGLEVFGIDPDWRNPLSFDRIWPVEQVDFGRGRTAQFRPIRIGQEVEQAEYNGLNASKARQIEQAFLRAKGRRGTFYRSTCRADMTLHADTATSTMVVKGPEIARDFGLVDYATRSQAIEIVQTNGTRVRRLVTDVFASGNNSAIVLNSAVSLTLGTTSRISWLPKARFAGDDLTTEWITPNLAAIRTAFQTVDE